MPLTQFHCVAIMAKMTASVLMEEKIKGYIRHMWDNFDLWHQCHNQDYETYIRQGFALCSRCFMGRTCVPSSIWCDSKYEKGCKDVVEEWKYLSRHDGVARVVSLLCRRLSTSVGGFCSQYSSALPLCSYCLWFLAAHAQ